LTRIRDVECDYADTLCSEVLMRAALLTVMVVLSCGIATASAQRREVGAKVGATSASLEYATPAEDQGYGHRLFVGGGAFLVQPITGPLAFQLEGLYMPKGAERTDTQGSVQVTTTLMLDYFEIPALARVSLARAQRHNVYVFGGPFAAMRLSAKFKEAAGRPVTSGVTTDIGSDIKFFDYGLVAGGGVDISHVVIDARYSWGLTDVNKDGVTSLGARNRVLAILVGFRY
jgi:hypothetical protein